MKDSLNIQVDTLHKQNNSKSFRTFRLYQIRENYLQYILGEVIDCNSKTLHFCCKTHFGFNDMWSDVHSLEIFPQQKCTLRNVSKVDIKQRITLKFS